MKFVIFGGGMQGRIVAADLAARGGQEVVVADLRPPPDMPAGVRFMKVDALEAAQVERAVAGADAAVLALPGGVARAALENLVDAGARTVDVSFTPDPPLDLHRAALARHASVILDCGVAPGLSHILAGAAHRELGGLDILEIYVGGIPQRPVDAFHHAVYFNPRDLIAEYLRPARMREGGVDLAPAPFDAEVTMNDDPEFGPLDAFLSDGLRSLLTSFPDVPDMVERTLRWPGHLAFMRGLSQAGLLDDSPLVGAPECTADSTARALGATYPGEEHPDALIMEVHAVRGDMRRAWRLVDRATGGVSAMGRSTAFTAAAVAFEVATNGFAEGVHAPERIGADADATDRILADLSGHGVHVDRIDSRPV